MEFGDGFNLFQKKQRFCCQPSLLIETPEAAVHNVMWLSLKKSIPQKTQKKCRTPKCSGERLQHSQDQDHRSSISDFPCFDPASDEVLIVHYTLKTHFALHEKQTLTAPTL